MGPVDLENYTIQADIWLTEENGRLPDIGLINSRYTLTLRGQSRKLRLTSWSPSDYRAFAEIEFAPQPRVWYRLKLSVRPEGSQATVQGKIWPRDQPEPDRWGIEMTDPAPNLTGSPGLYGNASEAEIYLDNLQVTINDQ